MKKNELKFYYHINLAFDPRDHIYVAIAPELLGCHSHGNTPIETLENVQEAIELWVKTTGENNIPIPRPKSKREFSGKFVLRTTMSLGGFAKEEAITDPEAARKAPVEEATRETARKAESPIKK